MKHTILLATFAMFVLSLRAQEPVPHAFIHEMSVEWVPGEAAMIVRVVGSIADSSRYEQCPGVEGRGLYIDTKKTRVSVEDAEGRRCRILETIQQPVEGDSLRLIAKAKVTFIADDDGSPRLPIHGRVSIRMHEVSPDCFEVEHIVHMIQWTIRSTESGTVTDYRDNYMSISID